MRQPPSAESQRIFAPGIFAGQVALITGGGSGIGLAAAVEFARLGARVAICGRTQARLDHGREVIAAAGSADCVYAAVCDIRQPDSIDVFVGSTLDRFGRIDILVNNAGGQFPAPAQAISPNGFAAVVSNNLLGTFNMTRAVALRALIPQKSGRVINVIANIYRGFPGMAHTGAARAGVENLTMTLAVEWSPFGILVNAVAPGIVESTGTKQYPPQLVEQAVKKVPLRRAGTVEEVAACIVFLASPAAQYISGTTVRIDGCQSLHGDTFPLPE
jgi:citronellol/citronellal dehydrogenase